MFRSLNLTSAGRSSARFFTVALLVVLIASAQSLSDVPRLQSEAQQKLAAHDAAGALA